MAATIARAKGRDNTGRIKEVSRLGSHSSWAQAATWHTFAMVQVLADGSGWVKVERDGRTLFWQQFGPEDEPYMRPVPPCPECGGPADDGAGHDCEA